MDEMQSPNQRRATTHVVPWDAAVQMQQDMVRAENGGPIRSIWLEPSLGRWLGRILGLRDEQQAEFGQLCWLHR